MQRSAAGMKYRRVERMKATPVPPDRPPLLLKAAGFPTGAFF